MLLIFAANTQCDEKFRNQKKNQEKQKINVLILRLYNIKRELTLPIQIENYKLLNKYKTQFLKIRTTVKQHRDIIIKLLLNSFFP